MGIVGATRGYGYTLLAQMKAVRHMRLRAVCSRHTEECAAVLKEIGYEESRFAICADETQIKAAGEDAVIIVADYRLMLHCGITALVEATGNTALSADIAVRAIDAGINVYMVSKETDSVCGPALNARAERNGVIYTLVNGDQPRNLLDLCSWARLLGLEIICAGKSSEYDFVWDRDSGMFTCSDGMHVPEPLPGLKELWHFRGKETLEQRRRLLRGYCETISADLCEMNLVCDVTGMTPAAPALNYPIARISELADIFIPEADGGILKQTGTADVFYHLRETDEASFCGGEFIIVRCENEKQWDILAGKGHVVSKNRQYCCIYHPYHFMGMETPVSILLGDLQGVGTHPECRQNTILACVAGKDLPAGTVLRVEGHHHEIGGTAPRLLTRAEAGGAAPYYLLNGAALLRGVKAGQPVTLQDVDLTGLRAYALFREGLAIEEA